MKCTKHDPPPWGRRAYSTSNYQDTRPVLSAGLSGMVDRVEGILANGLTHLLIPRTSRDAHGWCMLRHFPEKTPRREIHTPRAHTPQTHTPQAHTPQTHTPQTHTPQTHTPQAHIPQAHTPQTHTPQAHTPQAHIPQAHTQ